MESSLWALILAGGDGTRLQQLTRALTGAPLPKQYCRITGDHSLLEATLARIAPLVPAERTLVIVNRDHLAIAGEQLRTLPAENVLVQPQNRDTGPGVMFGLLHLARRAPQARLAVFPSDHYVGNARAFRAHVARAEGIVARLRDKVVLLGIRPDRPEPGYGYIEPAEPLDVPGTDAAFRVAAFREKPAAATARRLIRAGGLWNSFVMVFTVRRLLTLLARARPTDLGFMRRLGDRAEAVTAGYETMAAWNFSRDFLARVPRDLVVVRVEGTAWSDLGTPEAVARTLARLGRVPPWRLPRPAAAAVQYRSAPCAGLSQRF